MLDFRRFLSTSVGATALAAGLLAPPPASASIPPEPGPSPADTVWSLNLVAQTDSRAEMTPCHCPGIGGSLALRSGLFKRLRPSHEAFLMVDGGDAVPTDSVFHYRELAGLVVDAMERMHYDAAVPGETELALGAEALADAAARLPLVCANLSLSGGEPMGIPAVRWVEARGHTVAVTGYLDPLLYYALPGIFDAGEPAFLVQDPREALEPVLAAAGERADLVVLLAHAGLDQLAELLPQLSGVGVVVVGHRPEERTRFEVMEGIPVVVPGMRSREVSQVRLEVDPHGSARDAFHRVWDLRLESPEDPAVEAMVRKYEDDHGPP